MKMNDLDLWECDDNDDDDNQKSLAPLSINQQKFINELIDLIKDINDDDDTGDDNNADDVQDFNKWYDEIENDFHKENDKRIRNIFEQYKFCLKLTESINDIVKNLNNLDEHYSSIIDKTKSFYSSCDTLIQQQQNLQIAIDSINEKLSYFDDINKMSKKFSSPTMLILNESLIPTLQRLDQCIEFMRSNNNNYLECNKYLMDYNRLQISALNMIRIHIINTLKQNEKQVMPENDQVLQSNESIFTLYYGKFQLNSNRIKTLIQQIEIRTNQSELYQQYLNDCHQCYYQIRLKLIIPILQIAMDEMINNYGRNFCTLIRSSSKLYINIIKDEYQLYFQFFQQFNNDNLQNFLEQIASTLYDKLRPIIIHLEHLESLSELCSLIKYEFIEENLNQDDLLTFIKCMQQLLQDTQERLVYRCNVHIEKNILNYQPVSGDLAYPEKLEMMKKISETINNNNNDNDNGDSNNNYKMKRSDSVSSIISSISDISFVRGYHHPSESSKSVSSRAIVDLHGMWYPTVRSSIMVLSKLYRSLDKLTFQGLSQEVLIACIESLELASLKIKQRKSLLDSYLFIIKYLLIIREQIQPFHIDQITSSTSSTTSPLIKEIYIDFSRTKNAMIDLIQKRENLFTLTSNNSLLKFLFESTPQINEKIINSQKQVDNKIKEKCEQFIWYCYDYLTNDLSKFIMQLKDIQDEQQQQQLEQELIKLRHEYLERKQSVLKSMSLYLSNNETEAIIFKQIHNKIQELFEQLVKIMERKEFHKKNVKILNELFIV